MKETVAAATIDAGPPVSIVANFAGANVANSGLIPPDTDGAVGPDQFVEFLNGSYRVYDQSGALLQHSTLAEFWSSAGVTPLFPFDPRVLFDPSSQRWFTSSADNTTAPSNILLAVSKTSDPTQGWQAVAIPNDPSHWFDFPTLGINQDGIFLSAHTIPISASVQINPDPTIVAIPKSDLLGRTPTAANATVFSNIDSTQIGPAVQPAVAPQSSGAEPFLSAFGSPEPPGFSTLLKGSSVDGPITNPTLDTGDRFISVPPFQNPSGGVQKGTTVPIAAGDAGFSSSVIIQNDKLFGVQTIESADGHPELRWLEIGNPLTAPVLLDSGIIHPANLDVYYGSIAVNPLGEVVIGYSGSGPNDYPSAYAVTGTLNGDVLQLGEPMLLKAGAAPDTTGRFGDYSTTTYDPNDPSHFWTIQEWTSAPNTWSTEITEIDFGTATTAQTWFGGTGNFSDPQNWLPPGPPASTDTLVIKAGTVRAIGQTLTNPNIDLGSDTSTPTLVLKDTTLAPASSIRVATSSFDMPQPEFNAKIKVVGRVTEDGAIDVGTTGTDVNQLFPAHLTIAMDGGSRFTMDPGAIWFSSDGSTLEVNAPDHKAFFVNNGEIEAFGGTVTMNVPVTGHGRFDVLFNNNDILAGTLDFGRDVSAGQTINLAAGLLKLDRPRTFHGSIQGFNTLSSIEIKDAKITSTNFADGVVTLFDRHKVEAQLDIAGDFKTHQFAVRNEAGNTFITLAPSASV
jgi:hypothetical protein